MSYRTDKQVIDTHTDTRTDTQTQAMTIPEGQNWPRVKMAWYQMGYKLFPKSIMTSYNIHANYDIWDWGAL